MLGVRARRGQSLVRESAARRADEATGVLAQAALSRKNKNRLLLSARRGKGPRALSRGEGAEVKTAGRRSHARPRFLFLAPVSGVQSLVRVSGASQAPPRSLLTRRRRIRKQLVREGAARQAELGPCSCGG